MQQRHILTCQGQHGSVGKMKEGGSDGQDDQWPSLEQHTPACGMIRIFRGLALTETARSLMVNRAGRNRCNSHDRQGSKQSDEVKDRSLREQRSDGTGDSRDSEVPNSVESGVPAKPGGEPVLSYEAERDGGNGRGEHATEHCHGDIGRKYDW